MRADLRRKSVPDANHVRVHHNPNPIEHPHVSGTPLRLEGERTGAGHCFLHHLRTEHIPPPPPPRPAPGRRCVLRERERAAINTLQRHSFTACQAAHLDLLQTL